MQRSTATIVRAAGYAYEPDGETTNACMTFPERPTTPHEVRKYRRSYFAEPGVRVSHPGVIDDYSKLDKTQRMGDATIDSDHVSHVFQAQQGSWYTNHMNDIAEKNYVENTLEPLGKPYVRGHNLPAVTKEKGFAFGLVGETCESAKNLLYPQSDSDEAAHHDQYVRSHGSYQPGEQRTRGYKWENTPVHPGVHRFGVKPVPTFDGVSECLHPTSDSQSRLISTRVDAYKDMTKDKLGQAKNLGMEGGRNLPADHAFGVVKKVEHDHWGTAECIQGDYSVTEQRPDSDLGRSIAPGWRNNTQGERVFGVPTLRHDIHKPSKRSISDNQNYGDDTNAAQLVRPDRFCTQGVEDDDFHRARPQDEVREIYEGIGTMLDNDEFAKIWWRASRAGKMTPIGSVCVEEFRLALNERDTAKRGDKNNEPAWWADAPDASRSRAK